MSHINIVLFIQIYSDICSYCFFIRIYLDIGYWINMNVTPWEVYSCCQFPLLSVSSHLSFLSGDSRRQRWDVSLTRSLWHSTLLHPIFHLFPIFHSFPIPPFSQFSTQHQMFPPFQMFQVKWLLTKEKIHSKYSLIFSILSYLVLSYIQ